MVLYVVLYKGVCFKMNIQTNKAELRDKLKKEMCLLSPKQRLASDEELLAQLLALPWLQQAQTVFTYVSVGGEPDTRQLAEWVLKQGKTLAVPRCLGKGIMEAHKIAHMEELLPAPFGLLEPGQAAPLILPADVDLVVVPCLAANIDGHRIGYGGGYYDRYLQQVACPTVCLCREQMLQNNLPIEYHDQQVSAVLTENKVFYTNLPNKLPDKG